MIVKKLFAMCFGKEIRLKAEAVWLTIEPNNFGVLFNSL
jgi:hypothetical protein